MLTVFHGQRFNHEISKLEIDEEIKKGFYLLVNDFMKDLLEVADFDPTK